MTVGLLIVTHGRIGQELLDTATRMLGACPLQIQALAIPFNADPEAMTGRAERLYTELDRGDGVLVLTDIYGSTPSNIANRLRRHRTARVVAGLNLPMLIRVLNYPRMDLDELTTKAVSGGRDGVLLCHDPAE